MCVDASKNDEIHMLKKLRLDVLHEAREQKVVQMICRSNGELEDIPLDCNAIYLWLSGARREEEAAWQDADPESLLDMDLIRAIDSSAVVLRGPTLLPWSGILIVTTDQDAHERIALALADIIPAHARSYVVPEATVEPMTVSFLTRYWTSWQAYLDFRKAGIDAMTKVEAARSLGNAAKHIEAAHAAGVKISPQVLAEAKTWAATILGLRKAARRLSDDRDTAYTNAGTMAEEALRRVYEPPRRQAGVTATAAGPKPSR
jgi:hypothetical protein